MLSFFFKHYGSWVTRFIVFDDASTDGSVNFLRSKPNVEVRNRNYAIPESRELSGRIIYNHCWKESRGIADWVIIVDIDEHLYHPNIVTYLAECKRKGVTLIPALGYEMLTDHFPLASDHLANAHTFGAPECLYSKPSIFDPVAIEEINFSVGGHTAAPRGRVILPEKDELLLLHYKHLGIEYTLERNSFLNEGRRVLDLQNAWGFQYEYEREDYVRVRCEIRKSLADLRDPSYVPWRDHREPRWWRPWWRRALRKRLLRRLRALKAQLGA